MDFSALELAEIERILAMVEGDGEAPEYSEEETPVRRRVCRQRRVRVC